MFPSAPPVSIVKRSTGIAGLDDVLEGGYPAGRTVLLSGGPGTGKTLLGLQFLRHGTLSGEAGLFLTFEERASAVYENARALGWDLRALEEGGQLAVIDAQPDPQAVLSGDFDLHGLLAIVSGQVAAMGAKRIVLDALDILMRVFEDPKRARNEIYALHDWLRNLGLTAILTAKTSAAGENLQHYDFLDFMADCVIYLDHRVTDEISTRRLRVIKYRGSNFGRNEYPYIITHGGVHLIPASGLELSHAPLGTKVSSGQPRLDQILDGGYRRASCILISGTSGTGKTTLVNTFVRSACVQGDRVLYLDFEESVLALRSSMLSAGIDLQPHIEGGNLQVVATMPEALVAEEHLYRAMQFLDRFKPDHVVLDAISSLQRLGSQQAAFDFVLRLVNICKERGITIFLINQTRGFGEEHEISGIGISSMVDTVIFLRYVEVGGEVNRVLLVMKARGSRHSNQLHEFRISNEGMAIEDLYAGEGGTLTGAARQEQEAREASEIRQRQLEMQLREQKLAQRRRLLEAELASRQAEIEIEEAELATLRQEELDRERSRKIRRALRSEENLGRGFSDRSGGREPEEGGAS